MRIILNAKKAGAKAYGEWDATTGHVVVKQGSVVSQTLSASPTFRGKKTIENLRGQYVSEGIVTTDVLFKSSSTAANFITGRSTNGLIVWKTEDGKTLKEFINELDKEV